MNRYRINKTIETPLPDENVGTLIKPNPNHIVGRISEYTLGANMEDLHYQMVGGLSSQLIHGESFFEPSRSEFAAKYGIVDGFINCGDVSVSDGYVTAREINTRLTSEFVTDTVQAEISGSGISDSGGVFGLILCMDRLQADNGWDWYSGYTARFELDRGQITLTKATKAHSHNTVAETGYEFRADRQYRLELRIHEYLLTVSVNGQTVLEYADSAPLKSCLCGYTATEGVSFTRDGGFSKNPLIENIISDVSMRWQPILTANGRLELSRDRAWFKSARCQKISFDGSSSCRGNCCCCDGEVGISNAGLASRGICFEQGKNYEGFLRVMSEADACVYLSLRDRTSGDIIGSTAISVVGDSQYHRIGFELISERDCDDGCFAITLQDPGTIYVAYAFLERGEWGRYNRLHIRRDLADAIIRQGVKLLRFNGGMIECDGYRFDNMHGDIDTREPYNGFYDRYCSSGYGPVEHIEFCEAAGIVPIVGLNLEETPETYARFVSYCNSPDDETRIADGRREPYNIKYLQIANESNIDERYVERFKAAALAIWQVDPNITLIPAGKVYGFTGDEESDAIRQKLAPHLELTEFVHDHQKKLIWDAHSFMLSDDMTEPLGKRSHINGAVGFSKLLTRLSPRLGVVKVGLMELNAGRYNHHRGLTHALEMQALHSEPEIFELAAMPNVSQPWDIYQTDWKAVLWTQGNIYYTQKRVFYQSAYYVDKIIAENWANEIIETELSCPDDALHVISGRCPDGDIVVRVMNTSSEVRIITLDLNETVCDRLAITSLSGDPQQYNTLTEPEKIAPVNFVQPVTKPRQRLNIAAYSFTLIRLCR